MPEPRICFLCVPTDLCIQMTTLQPRSTTAAITLGVDLGLDIGLNFDLLFPDRLVAIRRARILSPPTEQTSDHRAHLHEAFLKIDENEDGMISRDHELKSAIRESSITEVSRSSDVHASRLSQLRRHVHAARGGTRRHVPSGGPRRRQAHRLRRVCQGPGDLGAWSAVKKRGFLRNA